MSTTDTIRQAAALMRQRAAQATPGPWYPDGDLGVYAYGAPDQDGCPDVFRDHGASLADIEHMASWGPTVAVAVADWLDSIAERADAAGITGDRDEPHALAVARAYLNE